MREFGKSELFRYKCPICGSLNKRVAKIRTVNQTLFSDEDESVKGYYIQCCNCGHQDSFVRPGMYNAFNVFCGNKIPLSDQKCYALNKCNLKDCPLYGSYKADHNSGYDDEQGSDDDGNNSGNGSCCGSSNCGCGDKCNCKDNLGVYGDSNSNKTELTIKVDRRDDPKFV